MTDMIRVDGHWITVPTPSSIEQRWRFYVTDAEHVLQCVREEYAAPDTDRWRALLVEWAKARGANDAYATLRCVLDDVVRTRDVDCDQVAPVLAWAMEIIAGIVEVDNDG